MPATSTHREPRPVTAIARTLLRRTDDAAIAACRLDRGQAAATTRFSRLVHRCSRLFRVAWIQGADSPPGVVELGAGASSLRPGNVRSSAGRAAQLAELRFARLDVPHTPQ